MEDRVGMGSVAVGYGEAYFGDHSGEDERDWNSGDSTAMGMPKGISKAMRRCKASFWADSNMYFCMDSFLHRVGLVIEGMVLMVGNLEIFLQWTDCYVLW